MHESEVIHGQRDAVEHARPDEGFRGQREAQNDGDDEHEVNQLVEAVPHAAEVTRQLVLQRLRFSCQNLVK